MADPAVEAVRRAQDGPYAGCCKGFAKAAAREALKPIRAEFQDLRAKALTSNDTSFIAGLLLALTRLTPLIYTTEELER